MDTPFFETILAHNFPRFLDSDQTIQSDPINLEPLNIIVLLTTKTVLYQKVKKSFELELNLTVPPTEIFPENGRWLGSFIFTKSSNLR